MSASIRTVEDPVAFASLRSAWDDLVSNARGSLYMSWPWLKAAWHVTQGEGQPILILVSAGERLLAAAALQRRRTLYYRMPLSEICFLGDGLSDRNEFLCRPDHPEAMEAIWRLLASNPWRSELLRLEQIPDTSATLATGRKQLERLQVEDASLVPEMRIQGTWDDYLQSMPWEMRRDLRKSERRLAEVGNWRIRHLHGKEIEAFLPAVRAIELAGYKSLKGKAFLADPRNEGFIRDYLEHSSSDSATLTLLEVDDHIVAYILGFVHGNTYHAYNTSFDEVFRKTGPGKYVYARAIRYAFERHLETIDFARGESHLKTRFGGVPATNTRAVYFYPGIKGSVMRFAVFWIRPNLKAAISHFERLRSRQT